MMSDCLWTCFQNSSRVGKLEFCGCSVRNSFGGGAFKSPIGSDNWNCAVAVFVTASEVELFFPVRNKVATGILSSLSLVLSCCSVSATCVAPTYWKRHLCLVSPTSIGVSFTGDLKMSDVLSVVSDSAITGGVCCNVSCCVCCNVSCYAWICLPFSLSVIICKSLSSISGTWSRTLRMFWTSLFVKTCTSLPSMSFVSTIFGVFGVVWVTNLGAEKGRPS